MKGQFTQKAFEKYLNDLSYDMSEDDYIIGGKMRHSYRDKRRYGSALRKYDPIAFQVGYKEWYQENKYKGR